MNPASYIYRAAVEGRGLKQRLFGRLRRLLLRFGNPDCEMEVHGRNLKMPLSHLLPWHRLKHPCYDSLLERLSAHLRNRDGELKAIDVGANIGDTLAAFHLEPEDSVLAIEPAPGFVGYLRDNWGDDDRVTIVEVICSSSKSEGGFVIEENDGTARILSGGGINSESPAVLPLDEMVEADPNIFEPNLIKIDTDGHDFEVLAGSSEVIGRSKPAVFFECDAFGNSGYFADCRKALAMFRRAGYAGMLVYDNFGYLMGRHSLDDLGAFEQLLTYQVISEFYYFDLLLIENSSELEAFYEGECQFFAERIEEANLRASLSSTRQSCLPAGDAVELAG